MLVACVTINRKVKKMVFKEETPEHNKVFLIINNYVNHGKY